MGYPAKPASVTSRTSPSPKPTSQVTGRPAAAAPTTGLGPKHIGTATTFPVQLPSPKSTNTLKPDSIATVVPTTKVALQVATTPSPTALTLPSAFTETSTPTPEVAQQVFVRVPLGTSVNIRRGANILYAHHRCFALRTNRRTGWTEFQSSMVANSSGCAAWLGFCRFGIDLRRPNDDSHQAMM